MFTLLDILFKVLRFLRKHWKIIVVQAALIICAVFICKSCANDAIPVQSIVHVEQVKQLQNQIIAERAQRDKQEQEYARKLAGIEKEYEQKMTDLAVESSLSTDETVKKYSADINPLADLIAKEYGFIKK